MKITIVYDNEAKRGGVRADWGLSCLVEIEPAPKILFDTGADGSILLSNMKELGINPSDIGVIVISHSHWDHTGGLSALLRANEEAKVYVPASFQGGVSGRELTALKEPAQICENVFTTGELKGMEQSLVINTDKRVVVVVGCSHPGVGEILEAASGFGKVYGIVGGFHGFSNFEVLEGLSLICPCHCTQHKSEIRRLFPGQSVDCGIGVEIEL